MSRWTIRFFTLTKWPIDEELMFTECLRLAALSEKAISFGEAMKLPVYMRKKLTQRYEAENEENNKPVREERK